MVYGLCVLCAVLALAVLLLVWKIVLLRRSAQALRRGVQERLETDTNTLLSIPSRDRAMCRLASDLNGQLRLLRRERQRHQQGDQALKEAVAGVSHDLRTPLTAICGYLDLLEREEKSAAAERYLAQVRNRTDRLQELMEEFFQYTVTLSSEGGLVLEELSLNRAVEEALAAWYAVLMERDISPQVRLPDAPVIRRLDAAALGRILSNILSNAVKYSGGDLAVTLDEDGALTFSNSAPGMTPVLVQRLFDRYFTVETGRRAGGLGLCISRELAEKMGGEIAASCQEEVLTVCLRFPPP